jgi:SAM-dependent methyltransferase
MTQAVLKRFAEAYAAHRAAEGRGHAGEALLSLPYLADGPLARQWAVRARTFEAFRRDVLIPATAQGRPLRIIDLGAGNGWLSYRVAVEGHSAVALDIRDDAVDGLGAAGPFLERAQGRMQRLVAAFEAIPLATACVDLAVFNASLHYAGDLAAVLREAARVVRPGGRLVILDSPFYRRRRHGEAMVAEKRAQAGERFGARADALTALPFIEFLTRDRLSEACAGLGLRWRRRRVLYPPWYELRPLLALAQGQRPPSRFDLWTSLRP